MPQPHNDPVATDDARALQVLRVYYGMLLGCADTDLRRSGWSLVIASLDCDPMALQYGQRPIVYIVSPVGQLGANDARGGVAAVSPELRVPVTALLRQLPPDALFTQEGLEALDLLVRSAAHGTITPRDEAHTIVRYTTPSGFVPYAGQLTEWIEPLDEAAEMDPIALGLLARYSGGVYVIRRRGAIASFAGIRPHSPHVAEVGVRTDITELRGHGLARAVVSRATRAILAGHRLPLYRHHTGNLASRRIAELLGYRIYAESVAYFAVSR
jgi:RimJ/RimL family protein N-acetyltransferase